MTTCHKVGQILGRAPSTFFRADQYSHLITVNAETMVLHAETMLGVISEVVGNSFLTLSQSSHHDFMRLKPQVKEQLFRIKLPKTPQ